VNDPVSLTVDSLCEPLLDLYGRKGVDDAIDACRPHMEPDQVRLLDSAFAHARLVQHWRSNPTDTPPPRIT
jgi:hypothetical protein